MGLVDEYYKNGAGGEVQVFRVRPESVEVREGEDVTLKCVVDNQQGRAQWTKDGFALGFERHVPGYPRYRYLGDPSRGEHHLIIKGVTLEDDGEYQCQVGPTMTSLPIWAAANVTVMVSPASISVEGVGDGGEVEVVAGASLLLECVVKDARPAPTVAWYRDAITLYQGMHQETVEASKYPRRWSVRSRLLLHPEAEDDGQQYSCRALHPALHQSPTTLVASVNLAVFHPPGPPAITGYQTGEVLVEGEQRPLVCQVVGGRPRPWVTWYRHGRPLNLALTHLARLQNLTTTTAAPSSSTSTTSSSSSTQGRPLRVVRVRQLVTAARAEDGAVYECRVSSDLLPQPLTTNVTLTVHYAPERVSVLGPAVVTTDQLFTLTCLTSPANPPATLAWRLQGSDVAPSGKGVVSEDPDGGWVTSSRLTHHLPTTHQVSQATAECWATHPVTHHPLNHTHLITVIKRPGWPVVEVLVTEGQEVVAGDQLGVLCTSRGGNPPPVLTLYKGGQKVASRLEQVEEGVTEARATLHLVPSDNGRQLTCEVSNAATSTPMVAHTTIALRFSAWEVSGWVSPSRVEAGQVVSLTCETTSSVPPSTVTWHSPLSTLDRPTVTHSQGLYGGTVTRSEVRLRVTAADNGRAVGCEADNGLGAAVATNITLNVLHGVVWLSAPFGVIDIEEGRNLTLRAHAIANPGPVRYRWWRGPGTVGGPDHDGGGELLLPRVHRQIAGNYTVVASDDHSAINSSFTINVLYGPEDVLAAERVVVDEDGVATILCSATGNPAPNITWTKDDDNTSSVTLLATGEGEARLVVEWASREDTGIYMCSASNIVSSPPPVFTAVVVTQAPAAVADDTGVAVFGSRAAIGQTGRLDCRVWAAPSPVFRWTTADGLVLSNNKKYSIHVPQLVDTVMEWSSLLEIRDVNKLDYTNYSCTSHNSRGSYTTTFSLSPPLVPSIPRSLFVTTVSTNTAVVTWRNDNHGAKPVGFRIMYRASSALEYELVDVPGSNSTSTTIKGLTPGFEYSFAISAYNERGNSDYSSPAITVSMPGMMEEVVSGSTVDGQESRVPRLILLLISLTGTALLVLNISIIVCFVKRQAIKRNLSASSSKTTTLDAYTPTFGGAAQGDEMPLASMSDVPPPPYKSIECKTRADGSNQSDVVNTPITGRPPEPHATPQSIKSSSPLLNGGINVQNDGIPPEKNELIPQNTHGLLASSSPPKRENQIVKEINAAGHSSNNPDVCPMTSSSHHSSLHKQELLKPYSEDQVSVSSEQSSDSYGFSPDHSHPNLASCHPARQTTQVIFHGQPHIQQQLEQQHKHYQQALPYCQQSQFPNGSQPHKQVSSLHSSLNPSQLSTSTPGCCDINCRQSLVTDIPMGYATLQPRRSCLKTSQYNALQRSHSAHNYTPSNAHSLHPPFIEMQTDICCQNSLYGSPQLHTPEPHRIVYGQAHEFPVYYARSRAIDKDCTRHNSISGQMGSLGAPYQEPKWSTVTPDICKVDSSSTKRVGWKEILHDSPGRGTMASRGSTDTSTSSTTSTITLGPTRFPQHCGRHDASINSVQNVDDQR
nr:nephrin-like [Procambarus clarkii]